MSSKCTRTEVRNIPFQRPDLSARGRVHEKTQRSVWCSSGKGEKAAVSVVLGKRLRLQPYGQRYEFVSVAATCELHCKV